MAVNLEAGQPPGVRLLQHALEILNDDAAHVYALTYDPFLSAWKVIRLDLVQKNTIVRQDSLYKMLPAGVDHNYLTGAIKDALILKKLDKV